MRNILLLCLLLCVTGCMTDAIGPFSAWNSSRAKHAAARRQVAARYQDTPKRVEAFALLANEDFIGAGVDLNAIHAWSEDPAGQTLSFGADGFLYGLAGYGINKLIENDGGAKASPGSLDRPVYTTITGDSNTVIYNVNYWRNDPNTINARRFKSLRVK